MRARTIDDPAREHGVLMHADGMQPLPTNGGFEIAGGTGFISMLGSCISAEAIVRAAAHSSCSVGCCRALILPANTDWLRQGTVRNGEGSCSHRQHTYLQATARLKLLRMTIDVIACPPAAGLYREGDRALHITAIACMACRDPSACSTEG